MLNIFLHVQGGFEVHESIALIKLPSAIIAGKRKALLYIWVNFRPNNREFLTKFMGLHDTCAMVSSCF